MSLSCVYSVNNLFFTEEVGSLVYVRTRGAVTQVGPYHDRLSKEGVESTCIPRLLPLGFLIDDLIDMGSAKSTF